MNSPPSRSVAARSARLRFSSFYRIIGPVVVGLPVPVCVLIAIIPPVDGLFLSLMVPMDLVFSSFVVVSPFLAFGLRTFPFGLYVSPFILVLMTLVTTVRDTAAVAAAWSRSTAFFGLVVFLG